MTDLVKDYLMKICTLLTGLFTVLIASTLRFSTCLCYKMRNCTLLAKFSTCLVKGYLMKKCTTCLYRGYMMESCTPLVRLFRIR